MSSDRKTTRARKLAEGWRDMSIWLTPDAVVALEDLKERMPEASRNDLIVRAIIRLADDLDAVILAESENNGTFTTLDNMNVDIMHLRSLVGDLGKRVEALESVVNSVRPSLDE